MKRNSGMNKIILSVAVVGLAIGDFGFRSRQLKFSTGPLESIQAGKSTEHAKHAGEGIVIALRDRKITVKVKAARPRRKAYRKFSHPCKYGGVVTLSGTSNWS